jgi:hypothetical protein
MSTERRYDFRIVFPVRYRGEVVTFQARSFLSKSDIKTVSASSEDGWVKTSNALYGYDRQRKGKMLVICEGPADAMRTGGVALFGSLITSSQMMLVSSLEPSEIVMFLDSDATSKVKTLMSKMVGMAPVMSVVQYGKDEVADPCSVENVEDRIQGATKFKGRTDLLKWVMKG